MSAPNHIALEPSIARASAEREEDPEDDGCGCEAYDEEDACDGAFVVEEAIPIQFIRSIRSFGLIFDLLICDFEIR